MHMKYFQPIADIKRHFDDVLYNIKRFEEEPEGFGKHILESWGVNPDDKADIQEEREALRYLLDCRLGVARDKNSNKPSIDIMNRCLNRHLDFLERVPRIHAYNVNKHQSVLGRKEYKACRHYLFKFSLPAWYEKMPDVILSFENKYPDFNL